MSSLDFSSYGPRPGPMAELDEMLTMLPLFLLIMSGSTSWLSMKRSVDVNRPGAHPAVERVIFDGDEVGQGGVVYQDVGGAISSLCLFDQPFAVLREGDVGRHRRGLAPRLPDLGAGHLQGAFEDVVAFFQGAGDAHDSGPFLGK